jgi:hypothetical protein
MLAPSEHQIRNTPTEVMSGEGPLSEGLEEGKTGDDLEYRVEMRGCNAIWNRSTCWGYP